MKSYLIYNDKDVIKTHDLRILCGLCSELCVGFDEISKQCSVLVQYVTDARYPSSIELTDYDVKKALEYAKEIKELVLKSISEGGI